MSLKKVHIAVSLYDENTFYIFRNDSTEVECRIDVNKKVHPKRYRLTKKEVLGIRNFFIGINDIKISFKEYKKLNRNNSQFSLFEFNQGEIL